jgi:hypothetical protein
MPWRRSRTSTRRGSSTGARAAPKRRYDKAKRRAFILAQVENPTIPPDDPRGNDFLLSEPVSSSMADSDDYDWKD